MLWSVAAVAVLLEQRRALTTATITADSGKQVSAQ
jgi:hypothetical protein